MIMLRFLVICTGLLLSAMELPAQTAEPVATSLSGQVDLARLVDLCAQRLGLSIEYDASALKSTITLRVPESLTDQELWELANRLLVTRGFTSVQLPGARDNAFSIVKIADAPGMARVEEEAVAEPSEGFVNIVVDVKHRPAKDLIDAIKLILSKPSGAASALGDRYVLISDLRPRVEDALRLIAILVLSAYDEAVPSLGYIAQVEL